MISPASLSQRIPDLHPSPIREILSVIDRPGMISFAGGLPSPDTFAAVDLQSVPTDRLQYGATEGEPALRAAIAEHLCRTGLCCLPEQVLVLSGSQQGIDLVSKLFIDAGTPVAVESPTYLAALQAFRFFGAACQPFTIQTLAEQNWQTRRPAMAYVIPTFQNPTGYCYSRAEREQLAEHCLRYGVPLFEDDPYRDLAYDTCERQPVCSLLGDAPWIYQGSFSKTLAPGLRLGFLAASLDLMPYLIRLKQAADLHSNRISQWLVLQNLQDSNRPAQLADRVAHYHEKRDQFADALQRHFGDIARWNVPAGGLFFWLQLHASLDTRTLLSQAIEHSVAYMPGEAFYPVAHQGQGTVRLNFSHATTAQMDHGLALLAELFREQLVA